MNGTFTRRLVHTHTVLTWLPEINTPDDLLSSVSHHDLQRSRPRITNSSQLVIPLFAPASTQV
jgi:hypothetical protein